MSLLEPIRNIVPAALTGGRVLGHEIWQWLGIVVVAIASYPIGRFASFVLTRIGLFFAKRTTPPVDDALVVAARSPLRMGIAALAFREGTEWLDLSPGLAQLIKHIGFSLVLFSFAWFAIAALRVIADFAEQRAEEKAKQPAETRAFRTQVSLLRRVATAALVIITIAVFLLQFELVRSVGLSLLASAGIVGVVLGLAAQKTIGAVIAGIQLSMTQPIRIGDTVFVDKDWGEIEEINLTYVVVKLGDGRRQIIPISRFLDQPFENWTKPDSKLLGTVTLPVDFLTPIEKLRPELERLCKANPKWDGRTADLRVSDATETTMVVRATVSAADPDATASLRLDVREGLLQFLRTLDDGAYLPRRRVIESEHAAPAPASAAAPATATT